MPEKKLLDGAAGGVDAGFLGKVCNELGEELPLCLVEAHQLRAKVHLAGGFGTKVVCGVEEVDEHGSKWLEETESDLSYRNVTAARIWGGKGMLVVNMISLVVESIVVNVHLGDKFIKKYALQGPN